MEIQKLIIWTLVVICLILPFYLIGRNISKVKKNVIKKLIGMAQNNHGKITDKDYWNKSAIGIDHTNRFVFYVKHRDDQFILKTINLSEIKRCQAITISQKINNVLVFEKLQLNFSKKQSGQADEIIEFYNNNFDGLTLTGELQLIEKWESLIKAHL